ncbi:MAG: hypothetical protein PF485_08270 [Bacteroidales bacterium]|jgi:hypothetical protein|nr:hypothetical protein [Bacteroidales bacterium]
MKKIIVAVLLTFFVLTIISSCRSKDCPAYGQTDVEQTKVNG